MKKVFFISFIIYFLFSCEQKNNTLEPIYQTVIIDSCEYIVKYKGVPSWEQTFHKGDCKRCRKF